MFPDESVIQIMATADPGEPVVNGIAIAKNDKIVVCRSYDSPVLNPKKDVLVSIDFNLDPEPVLVFNEEVGRHRYYSFFIQTTQGIFGDPLLIDFDGVDKDTLRIGCILVNKTADPNIRIRRTTELLVNVSPRANNFLRRDSMGHLGSTVTPRTAMLWRYFLTHILKNYPAAVNDDGTVRYWLDPTDYRKKIDGTESDWNNPDFDGNFCAWIGKYFLELESTSSTVKENSIAYRYSYPRDDLSLANFVDWNEEELEGFWISIMPYRNLENRPLLNSTAGDVSIDPTKTTIEYREMFRKLPDNDRRVPLDYLTHRQLSEILQWLYRTTNSQYALGESGILLDVDDTLIDFDNDEMIKSTLYPGFVKKPRGRSFHSTLIGAYGMVLFATDSQKVGVTVSNLDSRTNHAYFDPFGKVARISDSDYFNLGVIWPNYVETYCPFKIPKTSNALADGKTKINNVFPSNVRESTTATSTTYNCDAISLRYDNTFAAGEYVIFVRDSIPTTGTPNANHSAGVNSVYGHNKRIAETFAYGPEVYPLQYMYVKILPQPGYDPFEETGYHPWEDEADIYMKKMGYK